MIVWNTLWIFLVISKLIVSVQSGLAVDIYDFFLDQETEEFNENDSEYIRFLNKRNQRAIEQGIPFRSTKSGSSEEENMIEIERYCEPGCVRTGIWRKTNSLRRHSNPDKFQETPMSSNSIPFDNPQLKEYIDKEFKKIMDRIDEQIDKKLKAKIPDTPETSMADSHSNIEKEYPKPNIICEDKENVYYGPVPWNCSAYYICAFGDPHLRTCANGLLFCSSALQCVLKESAKCLERRVAEKWRIYGLP